MKQAATDAGMSERQRKTAVRGSRIAIRETGRLFDFSIVARGGLAANHAPRTSVHGVGDDAGHHQERTHMQDTDSATVTTQQPATTDTIRTTRLEILGDDGEVLAQLDKHGLVIFHRPGRQGDGPTADDPAGEAVWLHADALLMTARDGRERVSIDNDSVGGGVYVYGPQTRGALAGLHAHRARGGELRLRYPAGDGPPVDQLVFAAGSDGPRATLEHGGYRVETAADREHGARVDLCSPAGGGEPWATIGASDRGASVDLCPCEGDETGPQLLLSATLDDDVPRVAFWKSTEAAYFPEPALELPEPTHEGRQAAARLKIVEILREAVGPEQAARLADEAAWIASRAE